MKYKNLKEIYKFCPTCKNPLAEEMISEEKTLSCNACEFVYWNNPKPVVSIILTYQNKILMLQRAKEPLKDYWCLPGGFIRHDETPIEAIKRELKEETGLDADIERVVGAYRIDNDPRGIHIDIIYAGLGEGKILLSSENSNFEYFSTDSLPQQIAYRHREAIEDCKNTGCIAHHEINLYEE